MGIRPTYFPTLQHTHHTWEAVSWNTLNIPDQWSGRFLCIIGWRHMWETNECERILYSLQKAIPLFDGENYEKNKVLLARVAQIAEEKKCTTNQLALAWLMHKGSPFTVPIPGTTKIVNLESNVGAVNVKLSEEEIKALEAAIPIEEVSGERYSGPMQLFGWKTAETPPLSSWKRNWSRPLCRHEGSSVLF